MKLLVLGVDSVVGQPGFVMGRSLRGLRAVPPAACCLRRLFNRPLRSGERGRRAGPRAQESPGRIVYCGPFGRGSWDIGEEIPDAEAEARFFARLADTADTFDARLTILSTDAVFGDSDQTGIGSPRLSEKRSELGCARAPVSVLSEPFSVSRLFHDELSTPAGFDPLAVASRRVEQSVEGRPVLVVRTHAYGWSPLDYEPDRAEQIWQTMAEGRACVLDPRRYATPILATDLAGLLDRACRIGLSGLYHIAGEERISEYCFAAALAAAFDLPDYRIEAREKDSSAAQGRLPTETSLATRRAQRDLQRRMPSVREGLERFAAQRTNGWRRRFHAWSRAA